MTAWRGPALPGNRWDLASAADEAPQVSVVVTHYEQPAELARTLHALTRQTHPADRLEVVVADDGSARPPLVPPGVRLVRQADEGFRAAAARNRGAAATTGDVLVFLDADTTPEPDFVRRIARLPGVLAEAVVVGRRRHAELGGLPIEADLAAVAPTVELPAPRWLADGHRPTADLLGADETSFRFVISAVLAVARPLWEATGGFDETFGAYGGEDWEWAHRAWTHGALLAHEPAAVAWHDGPDRADRPGEGTAAARSRMLAETLAIADRVPVPGVAPTALLGRAGDPLVTLDPALVGDALVLTLDSLLAALPRAAVLLTRDRAGLLPPDPRVTAYDGEVLAAPPARSAWRHLHVHRPLTGPPEAWSSAAEALRGPGAAGRVDVRGADGHPDLTWTTVRAERRAVRWARDDLDPTLRAASTLTPLDSAVTVAARWGDWA